jgi:phosphomannomutase
VAENAINPAIFRANDIRGIVGRDLSDTTLYAIGRATGSLFRSQGKQTIVVGRDARTSSPQFEEAFVAGVRTSGINVILLGEVPTPVMYFAVAYLGVDGGAVISASHNPPSYNGVKLRQADPIYGSSPVPSRDLQTIKQIILDEAYQDLTTGTLDSVDIRSAYCASLAEQIGQLGARKVVLDGGNGVAGPLAVQALQACGLEVIPLYIEPDGRFPNHHPDPSDPKNLADLSRAVIAHKADIGIAFDGDGDRIGVVDNNGSIVSADRAMIILAQALLQQQAGASVVFDVMCSSVLEQAVRDFGGVPVRCKTGYSHMTAALRETQAVMGGERSGHIIASSAALHNYDDGAFAAARLLAALDASERSVSSLLEAYPSYAALPDERIPCPDERKFAVIHALKEALLGQGDIDTLDGVRLNVENGWGIIRASNTEPVLSARFEATTLERAREIRALMLGIVETFEQQG